MTTKKTILLDTSSLVSAALWKVDIFTELARVCDFPYHVAIVQGTLDELRKIMQEQRQKFRAAAKLALALLQTKKVPVLPDSGSVDDALARRSLQGEVVVTQDRKLKKRLQRPYLTLRQKKVLLLVK